jgi:hypothetical protein
MSLARVGAKIDQGEIQPGARLVRYHRRLRSPYRRRRARAKTFPRGALATVSYDQGDVGVGNPIVRRVQVGMCLLYICHASVSRALLISKGSPTTMLYLQMCSTDQLESIAHPHHVPGLVGDSSDGFLSSIDLPVLKLKMLDNVALVVVAFRSFLSGSLASLQPPSTQPSLVYRPLSPRKHGPISCCL